MTVYYNEIDPYAAQWLRNLIAAGRIAPGVVDTRSIEDVTPADLAGYTQCHMFAGLGGWSLALRLAGWPDDRPVWTGSCPCQPFSAAGKGAGFADERHLWPAFYHLIEQCRPAVVFGEQVASKAVNAWIDLVHADLEGMGYAFGSVPFPSAGVGAPHIRDRNYWMADMCGARGQGGPHFRGRATGSDAESRPGFSGGIMLSGLADTDGWNPSAEREQRSGKHGQQPQDGRVVRMADSDDAGEYPLLRNRPEYSAQDVRRGAAGGPPGHVAGRPPQHGRFRGAAAGQLGPTNGAWGDADWLFCRDGKWRPVEPGTFPLAHGIPGRVGRLRAYGNAINPYQAAEFIGAYLDVAQG